MQARQPTYFEALLARLQKPTAELLQEHDGRDPFSVLVTHILHADARADRALAELLDDDRFLKAGRAYTALLLENDRLPPGEQLTPEELSLPRALLLEFFRGGRDLQLRAQEVLALIERKFSQRYFQQANILLQLFETDQSTRLQNERKLFYEDMIQRLGIRRRQPLDPRDLDSVREHFQTVGRELTSAGAFKDAEGDGRTLDELAASITPWDDPARRAARLVALSSAPPALVAESRTLDLDPDTVQRALDAAATPAAEGDDPFTPLLRAFDWLAARHQVHFCLLSRDADDYRAWSRLVATTEAPSELLRFVPPSRWRTPVDFNTIPLLSQLAAALNEQALRAWMQATTRAAYFILLAVGDTGLEPFLDSYFDWLSAELRMDGTAFIDRLHRESTLGEHALDETLGAIFDDHFLQPLAGRPRTFTVAKLRQALQAFADSLGALNFSEVPPGHYNLTGFALDHLLEIKYPNAEFPFKIHRIV